MTLEKPNAKSMDDQVAQRSRVDTPTFDRATYWKHITLSFSMLLAVWPIVFLLPALPDDYVTDFSGWRGLVFGVLGIGYVVAMVYYQWSTVLRRVEDAQRSRLLWVIGLILLPYINFFLLIRLGLIKHSEDQSVMTASERVRLGFWVVAFTVVFWAAQLTVWMFGYVSSSDVG